MIRRSSERDRKRSAKPVEEIVYEAARARTSVLAEHVPESDRLASSSAVRRRAKRDRWKPRLGPTHALISSEQLRAAHLLHERARLSIPELARRGYEQWGYANVHSATVALYRLFRRYDYPPRSRAEANRLLATNEERRCVGKTVHGKPCKRSAMVGSSYCPYHRAVGV
jgi:hypothetical protein